MLPQSVLNPLDRLLITLFCSSVTGARFERRSDGRRARSVDAYMHWLAADQFGPRAALRALEQPCVSVARRELCAARSVRARARAAAARARAAALCAAVQLALLQPLASLAHCIPPPRAVRPVPRPSAYAQHLHVLYNTYSVSLLDVLARALCTAIILCSCQTHAQYIVHLYSYTTIRVHRSCALLVILM